MQKKTIIAGSDRVAVDAYAMSLFDVRPMEVEYLKVASRRGMGTLDLNLVHIKEISC